MANSAVVGLLRALLVADTAEFDQAMKRASDAAADWSKSLKKLGGQAEAVGRTLTAGLTLPLVGLAAGASKLAIDFESSFAGVRKTVDATEPELAKLSDQFRNLAKTIPVSVNEINKLAETAGALGVPTQAIAGFVEVMAGLGVATNLTADEAANSIARIQTIFGAAGKDTDRFASTLVGLGNAGASTEKEIVEMAQRISGAGHAIGLTQAQVLSLSSAMAGLGINAEAGGSSMSRILTKMNQAVAAGGDELKKWAAAAKTSAADFKAAFETSPAEALTRVVEGLAQAGSKQADVVQGLVGKNTTLLDTFQRLAGAGDNLRKTLALGDAEWEKNTALTNETGKRYETVASQLTILWNKVQDVGISLGQALLPTLKLAMSAFDGLVPILEKVVGAFTDLPAPVQALIIGFGAIAAAAGPALILFGSMVSGLSTLVGAFKTGGIAAVAFSETMAFLAANPVVLLLAGLAALGVAIYTVATAESDLEKEVRTNAASFKAQTTALDQALTTYHALAGQQQLTAEETRKLDDATRLLAEASGLSVEGFKKEATKSDELTRALEEQLKTRRDLLAFAINEQTDKVRAAQAALLEAEQKRNTILQGRGTVEIPGSSFDAVGGERLMTIKEQVAAELALRKEIEALNKAMEAERAKLAAMTGAKQGDIVLTNAQAAAEKKKGAAAAGAAEEETKAETKKREALEKTARAMSEAGVADKIAEMNAQMVLANKYGGIAKESWKKYTDQIEEWVKAGYNVPPLLDDFRHEHMDLLASQIKVTNSTTALLAQFHNYAPEIRRAGDAVQDLAAKTDAFQKLVTNPANQTNLLALIAKTAIDPKTLWAPHEKALEEARQRTLAWAHTFGQMMSGLWTEIAGGLSEMLVQGIAGAQSFADGFVNVWQGIKRKLTSIFNDILNLFINGLIRGMVGYLMGNQGAFSQAFAGLAGTGAKSLMGTVLGAGTTTATTAAGTTAAGTGAGAAAGGGLGSAGLLGAAAGSVAGAGAGGAVGYYVGYKSGSKTKGIAAGAATGAAVGALGGPIGMGVGAGVGALAGWYGAVKAGKTVNDIREAFAASQGSMEAIAARLKMIGREDLFKPFAFGERNIGAIKEAVGNIQEVFAKADADAAALATKQQEWSAHVADGFGRLGQAASAFGGTIPRALRDMIGPMLESKDLTEEMRAQLTGLSADPTWQTMAQKARDYGIELGALGGQFQEARLTETAQQYSRDLQMLIENGADLTGVVRGMSDELSTLYQDAAQNGVTLPESLRPYMEKLVEMGGLVDENGDKVENLNQVAFKDIEDKGLTDVVDVLTEIKDLLAKGLPQAAKDGAQGMQDELNRNAPRVRVGVDYDYGNGPDARPTSSGEAPRPELGLSGGTHGQYVDWGAGTDVTLHGRERVMTAGEAINGQGAPIQITVISKLDGREVARNQIKYIPRELALAGV